MVCLAPSVLGTVGTKHHTGQWQETGLERHRVQREGRHVTVFNWPFSWELRDHFRTGSLPRYDSIWDVEASLRTVLRQGGCIYEQ